MSKLYGQELNEAFALWCAGDEYVPTKDRLWNHLYSVPNSIQNIIKFHLPENLHLIIAEIERKGFLWQCRRTMFKITPYFANIVHLDRTKPFSSYGNDEDESPYGFTPNEALMRAALSIREK